MLAVNSLKADEALSLQLRGSFLDFVKVFFKLKTGRDFFISNPPGREPHVITIARVLKAVFNGQLDRALINVPPGHHKSTLIVYFIAWTYANHGDCNWLYISHAYELAEKHTAIVKEILEMAEFKRLFKTRLRQDSKAKGSFVTTDGGQCRAFGSAGAVVGMDGGLPHCDYMSGGVVIDDAHKAKDCHSDTIRQSVIDNYKDTIKWRVRGPKVPIIFIGQRLHEDDLPAFLINGGDGSEWTTIILPGLDAVENPLYPEFMSKEQLLIEREFNPYNFAAQIMQCPQPAGGGIFKPEYFHLTKEEPKILCSFITCDSAETTKTYNDKTAFSFFGIYKIEYKGHFTGEYGLHWIDCVELQCEPKDLDSEFFSFYQSCMRHPVQPKAAAIEKKSTGVTLISVLNNLQGIRIIEVNHARESNRAVSKSDRFLACQPYVASRRISLPEYGSHTPMCVEHCRKITANNSHRWDDICDSLAIGIEVALMDGLVTPVMANAHEALVLGSLSAKMNRLSQLKQQRWTNYG